MCISRTHLSTSKWNAPFVDALRAINWHFFHINKFKSGGVYPCKSRKNHKSQRGFTMEFTYSLTTEKIKIQTQVTASASKSSDHMCQLPLDKLVFVLHVSSL